MSTNMITLIIVGLFIITIILAVVAVNYWVRLSCVKKAFEEYQLYHSQFIVMYVEAAKDNRKFVNQIYKTNYAIYDSVFKPSAMNGKQIDEWKKKYELPHLLYPSEGVSNKNYVEKVLEVNNKQTKYYDKAINESTN